VAPSIVVTSDRGRTISNFGDIAVGHRGIKKVSIQNISLEDLAVEFSMLNPNGPFVLLNPISKLLAGETHVLTLSFSPHESILAQETLDIITKRGKLSLTLLGTGVAPMITCSIEGDTLDMGYVIARESVSSSFKLQNCSALPIQFSLQLDSLSRSRSEDQQRLPQFLASRARRTEVVGTQNNSGQSVFSVIPVKGIMDPGKAQDFTVTFSPDHESLYFSDRLQVMLFEKVWLHQPSLDPFPRVRGPPGLPHLPYWWLRARGVASWRGHCPRSHGPTPSWSPGHGSQDNAICSLSPETVPPDPSEGRGPRAHDVRGGRRPPGRACGVPDCDPHLRP